MRQLLLTVPLLCCGCLATSDDLRGIADAVADWETGAITAEELQAAIEAKADEIKDEAVAAGEQLPTDLNGWMAMLMKLGLLVGGGTSATMMLRNRNIFTTGSRLPPPPSPHA